MNVTSPHVKQSCVADQRISAARHFPLWLSVLLMFSKLAPVSATERTVSQPIHVPTEAKTYRDFAKIQRPWAQRVMFAPFKARLKGEPWNARAVAFVEKALDDWSLEVSGYDNESLSADGEAIVAEGCKDPLVVYLACYFHQEFTQSPQRFVERGWEALLAAEGDKAQPRALVWFLANSVGEARQQLSMRREESMGKALDAARTALSDESYREEEDAVLTHHFAGRFTRDWMRTRVEEFPPIFEKAKLRDWVRQTLLGVNEIDLAWKDRGSGFAGTVTDEGWKGMAEHLAAARKQLNAAWKARPDRPEAARAMIVVSMADSSEDSPRDWFDRAIAAQFDYQPAYLSMLWALRPRWGGSHEQMLAFGKACLDTGRYDLFVPFAFAKATSDIAGELDDPRAFFRRREVAGPLLALSHAAISEPTRAPERRDRLSYLAVNAWLCVEPAAGIAAIEKLASPLTPGAIAKLKWFDADETQLRGELAVAAGPARASFSLGSNAWARGDFSAAGTAWKEAAGLAEAASRAYIDSRLELLDFMERFQRGDWAKVPVAPGLPHWQVSGAKWRAEGTAVVLEGDGTASLALFRAPVGGDIEMRADVEIPVQAGCEMGFVVGSHRELDKPHWGLARARRHREGPSTVDLLEKYIRLDQPTQTMDFPALSHWNLRVSKGRATWEIDGKGVFHDTAPKEWGNFPADAFAGLGALYAQPGLTMRVRNLEFRRVGKPK